MTENEAIKYLECFEDWNEDDEWLRRDIMEEFIECCTKALIEIQQYNEQCRYHWIPVEERLPEEDERVMISTKNGVVKEGTYTERYGYTMRKGFFTENCFEDLQGVTAWQPLPEPYKGGQNEP